MARRALWELSAEAAGIGTYVLDVASGEMDMDEHARRLTGTTGTSTIRPRDVFARIPPEEVDDVAAAIEHAVVTAGTYSAEHRVVDADGTQRWVAVRGQTLVDDTGSVTTLVGALYDITALREASDRVTQVLESMSGAFYSLDHQWRFTYVNAEAEKLIGCSRHDAVGRVLWDLFPAAVGTEIESTYRSAAATGHAATFEAHYPAPLDSWFEIRVWPSANGLSVYFLDITQRIEAQRAEQQAVAQRAADALAMAALVAVAQALGEAESEAAVLDVVTTHGASVMGAAGAGLCLINPDRASVRVLTTAYFDTGVRAGLAQLPADSSLPIVRAAVTGRAYFLPDRAAAVALAPRAEDLYRQARTEGSAEVPLRVHGRILGTLSLAFAAPLQWRPAQEELAQALAAMTAQALDRLAAREAEQSANAAVARFSETLQRSLLTSPPQPDHLQIAVGYVPAAATAQVGGDWYDAFVGPDGVTRLVIGDVTGHDSRAAATMAALRNLLRGVSHAIGGPPAPVVEALDRAAHDLDVEAMATLVLAHVEQGPAQQRAGTRLLRWSNAGHLPPLRITPDGHADYLDDGKNDLLVGLDPTTDRRDHVAVLHPGDTVLLFTDGLVERRDASLQAGLDWLAEVVADLVHLPLDDLLDALLAAVGAQVEDDVAVLAMRTHPEDAPRPPETGPDTNPAHAPDPAEDQPR